MAKQSGSARLLELWDLLVYLDRHPFVPLAELAREFNKSQRKLRDDLMMLAGIETPGNIGFYLVDLDYDLLEDEGLVKLSLQDSGRIPVQIVEKQLMPIIAGLEAIATSGFVNDDPTRAEVIASALTKIAKVAGIEASSLDLKLPDAPNAAIAKAIASAINTAHQLEIEYVNSDDIVTDRIVDPAMIVMQNRYAYLRAWCHKRNEERAFRVDRILGAKPIGPACENHLAAIAPNADVAGETAARSEHYAVITLAPAGRWLAEELPARVEQLPDGALRLTLPVTSRSWLKRLLLGIAPLILALEPAALADDVAAEALTALANYEL